MSQTSSQKPKTDAALRELIIERDFPNQAASIAAFNEDNRRIFVVDAMHEPQGTWAEVLKQNDVGVDDDKLLFWVLAPLKKRTQGLLIERETFYEDILQSIGRISLVDVRETTRQALVQKSRLDRKRPRRK